MSVSCVVNPHHTYPTNQMEARDATTYTTAVAALARCGAWKEALEAAKRADQEDKVAPTAGLYHAAMFACTKGQPAAQWTECLDLLREMKGRGIAVGATAYNTAILCAGIAHEVGGSVVWFGLVLVWCGGVVVSGPECAGDG